MHQERMALRALTAFNDPAPQLTGIQKRLVTYTREDGVPLSGTLYLPPDTHQALVSRRDVGLPDRVRVGDRSGAGDRRANRFNIIRGPRHLFFPDASYAVFRRPQERIGGERANSLRRLRAMPARTAGGPEVGHDAGATPIALIRNRRCPAVDELRRHPASSPAGALTVRAVHRAALAIDRHLPSWVVDTHSLASGKQMRGPADDVEAVGRGGHLPRCGRDANSVG